MKFGNYDLLARNYRKFRPSYNSRTLGKIFSGFKKKKLNVVDIGAGTGILTKILTKINSIKKIYAIEPSFYMRKEGKCFVRHKKVTWKKGSAEKILLKKNSIDVITSASSFHWYNKNKSLKEFSKVLKKGGYLILTWNPRITNLSLQEKKIEEILKKKYGLKKRISSGSKIGKKDLQKIFKNSYFKLVDYHETINKKLIIKKNYVGAWKSVNDVQVQLGNKFKEFINDIEILLKSKKRINVFYLSKFFVFKHS